MVLVPSLLDMLIESGGKEKAVEEGHVVWLRSCLTNNATSLFREASCSVSCPN